MSKRIASWALAGGLCLATGWCANALMADDKPANGGMSEADMKTWAALATPGAPHESMKAMVGKWKIESTVQMTPDAPVEKTTGEATNTLILGGRWLKQESSGTMMNMPYEDLGLVGYDNAKQKYVSVWFTTMCTSAMTMYGDASADGKTVTYADTVDDPMKPGTKFKMKIVVTNHSADETVVEFYEDRGQGERKSMTSTYTRVK